jgi:two-component system, OmpR family, response regulator
MSLLVFTPVRRGRRLAAGLCSRVSGRGVECNDLYLPPVQDWPPPYFDTRVSRMSTRPRILLIEDDPEIRQMLRDYLQREGFRVDVGDGGAALDRFRASIGEPDLVVLDIMLPGEDGLSICRRIRASARVPILMLTARGEDIDRIVGLEMGADDYLPKPFNPRELVARIRAILRRAEAPPVELRRLVVNDDLVVDLDARSIARADGTPIPLTSAEFDLLQCFLTRPCRVLSREQLMDWTRGRQAEPLDRTIDVQVSRVRKKIEHGTELIKTVRNAGYLLSATVREA